MLASAIVCHLSPQGARKYAARERAARRRAAMPDAPAPVRLATRLSPTGDDTPVETLALDAATPPPVAEVIRDAAWPGGLAPVIRDEEAARAALRNHLSSDRDYGPVVTRVALVAFVGQHDVQQLVIHGRLSAVERTIPDEATRRAWAAAGVTGLDAQGQPRALQVEVLPTGER